MSAECIASGKSISLTGYLKLADAWTACAHTSSFSHAPQGLLPPTIVPLAHFAESPLHQVPFLLSVHF